MATGWIARPTMSLIQVKRNFIGRSARGGAAGGGGLAKLAPLDLPQGRAAAPCGY